MCLSKVSTAYDKPSGLIESGWKVFGGTGSSLKFENFGGTVPQDVWLRADEIRATVDIVASDGTTYKAGFHVYANEGDKPRGARHVYLRRITCAGEQQGRECVIAHEMYVPSKPDAWPPPTPAPPHPAWPSPKKLVDRIRKAKGKS